MNSVHCMINRISYSYQKNQYDNDRFREIWHSVVFARSYLNHVLLELGWSGYIALRKKYRISVWMCIEDMQIVLYKRGRIALYTYKTIKALKEALEYFDAFRPITSPECLNCSLVNMIYELGI